jgi:small subunit ribosomal protein S6
MESTEKSLYEGMFVLPQTYVREDQTAAFALLSETMEKFGAGIRYKEIWAERPLAYEINHVRDASYILMYFDASSEAIAKIERQFRITDNVLRVLIVNPPKDFCIETFLKEKEAQAKEEAEASAALEAQEEAEKPVATEEKEEVKA